MKIRVRVEDYDGNVLHNRIGTINARYPSTIKAAHTRIMNRLQRIYAERWKQIEIKNVEENK